MGSVELYWIPLGADGNPTVRLGGRFYEGWAARRDHREPRPLYHSALVVRPDKGPASVVEMTPAWSDRQPDRGVVVEGPVGLRALGRSRMFRYEVRRWCDGVISDVGYAEGGELMRVDDVRIQGLLDLVPRFPPLTWGRDESRTGDMWNSNSLVSWLLARSALPFGLSPPRHGRAPGWAAGIAVAERTPHQPLRGGTS